VKVFNKIKILKSYLIVLVFTILAFYTYDYFFNSNSEVVKTTSKIENVKITNIKSVSEWNNKIHTIYSSLNMYDIVDLSNQIEWSIHNKFVQLHYLFVNNVNKKNVDDDVIGEIRYLIQTISNNSSYYSRVISDISDASWGKTLDRTEPLTIDNLPFASNITLIKRLFNFKSSSLGVNRSSYK